MTKGLKFLQTQLKLTDRFSNYLNDLELWMKTTKNLAKNTGFKFTPRINIRFPQSLRKITNDILKGDFGLWENSVIEIWQNKENWLRLYLLDKYIEI